jgi:hypothetical protein
MKQKNVSKRSSTKATGRRPVAHRQSIEIPFGDSRMLQSNSLRIEEVSTGCDFWPRGFEDTIRKYKVLIGAPMAEKLAATEHEPTVFKNTFYTLSLLGWRPCKVCVAKTHTNTTVGCVVVIADTSGPAMEKNEWVFGIDTFDSNTEIEVAECLIVHIQSLAKAVGIKKLFTCEVSADNDSRQLLRRLGFKMKDDRWTKSL